MNNVITQNQLTHQLRQLDLKEGDIVNIKASIKSIGNLENGPQTLLDSLLEVVGLSGTIVTDSFLKTNPIFILPLRLPLSEPTSPSYAGAMANIILKNPKVFRSNHPIQKFAVIGKHASTLINQFDLNPVPYGLLNQMAELGGKNLRIGPEDKVVGVGTTHIAIENLKYRQKRIPRGIRFVNTNGQIAIFKENWANGCPKGFNDLLLIHKQNGNFISDGLLGETIAQLSYMSKTLQTEMEILSTQPNSFLCKDPYCVSCRTTWNFNKNNVIQMLFKCISAGKFKKAIELVMLQIFGVWHPRKK